MNNPTPRIETASEAKKKEFPWLVFGVPIGCAIGIAIRNLALGVGIGMLLAGILTAFRAKRAGRKISPVIQIALVVACAAVIALGFIMKK